MGPGVGKNGYMSDDPARHFKLDQAGAEALPAYDAKWIHDQLTISSTSAAVDPKMSSMMH